MSRILIDLTDIQLWNGQHGGIQRVVYGITKNYYLNQDKLKAELGFIAYSDQLSGFYFTDFTPIYDRVEAVKTGPSGTSIDVVPSLKARVKYHVKRFVPLRIRQNERARQAAKKSLTMGLSAAHKTKHIVAKFKPGHQAHRQTVDFQANDIVLVLGSPWDNPNIQAALTRDKRRAGFQLVQVAYDLIISLYPHLHHPSLFAKYTQHMFEAAAASDLMLPISKSTDKDLKTFCKRLNLPTPASQVIRLGDDIVSGEITNDHKPDGRIANKFIACVGTLENRKNHTLLYYVYKLAQAQGIDLPQLVIVGRQGWLAQDIQYLIKNDQAINEKIIILETVSDPGLAWIYQNCQFTVYPSMYEGWGLPVAESFAYGKPCVASNTSSIPEIAGDLAEYFSPYNPQECLDLLAKYGQPDYLQKRVEQAAKYKTTTWAETYDQVAQAIDKFIKD